MSDFDWHGEKDWDAIILNYQPPTAVYSTKGGNVLIRQRADETEEYDPQIFLTPQGALAVAWALIEEAHLVGLPVPSGSLMSVNAEGRPIDGDGKPVPRRGSRPPANSDDSVCAGPLLAAVNEAAE